MSTNEWKELQAQEFRYLDEIDLQPYLIPDKKVSSIMDTLERMFQADYTSKTGDECLFNVIDEYEFAQYLKERYHTQTYEYSEFRIR